MDVNIDKLVAEHVMGWDYSTRGYFTPTADMNHALQVIEKLKTLGFNTLLRNCVSEDCGLVKNGEATREDYFCSISIGSVYTEKFWFKTVTRSPQMAVCLSALKAVGFIGVIDND